jgi:hypothetical protein
VLNYRIYKGGIFVTQSKQQDMQQVVLRFTRGKQGVTITWHSDLFEREETVFTTPYDEVEIEFVLHALNVVQYPNYPQPSNQHELRMFTFPENEKEILAALGLWQNERVSSNAYRIVGAMLYQGLGTEGHEILKKVRNNAIIKGVKIDYVLRFHPSAADLIALPWELLWDREKNQPLLIRGNIADLCERHIETDSDISPLQPPKNQLHILALSPMYNLPDDIRAEEQATRRKSWDQLKAEGNVIYHEISPLTRKALNDYLNGVSARPDIIHYFGHANNRDGITSLIFDDADGGADRVSTERLAALLSDAKLVMLIASSPSVRSLDSAFTNLTPALSLYSRAVVGMQFTFRIKDSLRFCEIFYDQLLNRRRSIQEAMAEARRTLFIEDTDGASWYAPTLYLQSPEFGPLYLVGSEKPPLESAIASKLVDQSVDSTVTPKLVDQVVLVIHGIRTRANWQGMVRNVLEESNNGVKVIPLRYGYFDAFSFWFPFFTRKRVIQRILREIRFVKSSEKYIGSRLSVIAHSFGTYAITKILEENTDVNIYRIILCGSIVREDFIWGKIAHQIEGGVVNDYGKKDIWPVLAKSGSWGYGESGRFGFGGGFVEDRAHLYDHGGYFNAEFVREYWKSFIETGEIKRSHADEDQSIESWFVNVMSLLPIRYFIVVALILIIVFLLYIIRLNAYYP